MRSIPPKKARQIYLGVGAGALLIVLMGVVMQSTRVELVGAGIMVLDMIFHLITYHCPHCGRYLGRTWGDYCPFCGGDLDT